MARQLDTGDLFPEYTVSITDGRNLKIPQDLKGGVFCFALLPRRVVTSLPSAVGQLSVTNRRLQAGKC